MMSPQWGSVALEDIPLMAGMSSNLYKAVTNGSAGFPISTTTGREMSIDAAYDGTNFLVGIQGDHAQNNFIDGEHTNSAAYSDFISCLELYHPNAIIAFYDS